MMKLGLLKKFTQNPKEKAHLLSTKGKYLLESTMHPFWGCSALYGSEKYDDSSFEGRNMLGELLVEIRDKFLHEERIMAETENVEKSLLGERTARTVSDDLDPVPDPTQTADLIETPAPGENREDD